MKRHLTTWAIICVLGFLVFVNCRFCPQKDNSSTAETGSLAPVFLSEQMFESIIKHVDEEKRNGRYMYPDTLLCASIWFDFRQQVDSLYILGGLMAIYDEDLIQTEDTFMGYYRQKNVILCFASMGEDNLSLIPHILDTNALIKDKNKYYYEIESIVTSFKGLNHCLNSASIYYLTDDGRLVFSKRRFIR